MIVSENRSIIKNVYSYVLLKVMIIRKLSALSTNAGLFVEVYLMYFNNRKGTPKLNDST